MVSPPQTKAGMPAGAKPVAEKGRAPHYPLLGRWRYWPIRHQNWHNVEKQQAATKLPHHQKKGSATYRRRKGRKPIGLFCASVKTCRLKLAQVEGTGRGGQAPAGRRPVPRGLLPLPWAGALQPPPMASFSLFMPYRFIVLAANTSSLRCLHTTTYHLLQNLPHHLGGRKNIRRHAWCGR